MFKPLMVFAAVCALASYGLAQKPAWQPAPGLTTIPLWPNGAPGAQPNPAPEVDTTTAKDNLIAGKPLIRLGNVSNPTLTLYPPKGKQTAPAIVVFPGGGYRILAIDLEGTEVCTWLNSAGIACVLVKYRVPDSGPYPKSSAALQDAQRALGIVRQHAAEWHIDPKRVGVLGFSAGGHLAAAISTHYDKRLYDPIDAADQLSCRPDFALVTAPTDRMVCTSSGPSAGRLTEIGTSPTPKAYSIVNWPGRCRAIGGPAGRRVRVVVSCVSWRRPVTE